jgi:hypothetical protein
MWGQVSHKNLQMVKSCLFQTLYRAYFDDYKNT